MRFPPALLVVFPFAALILAGTVLLLGRIENLNQFSAICRNEPSRLLTD